MNFKPTPEVAALISQINKECFGDDDFYNDAARVEGCDAFCLWGRDEICAYALFRPGRVATLERYAVRPKHAGTGKGTHILKLALRQYKAVSTYASATNGASCAALLKAGFFITGSDNGFITFMWLRDEAAKTPV